MSQEKINAKLDSLLDHRDVPKADKLLLAFLCSTYPLRGANQDLDNAAFLSIDYLKEKYPEIFEEARRTLDEAEKKKAAGEVH